MQNKEGGVLEIGIHHGQFFIALNQLIDDHQSYAVDVFDDQHLNIDFSGEGDYHQFIDNLNKFDKHRGQNVKIIKGDSTDNSIFDNISKCHYVSVDGGHTVQHVINDLTIATNLLTNNGIVIVDDYFNHWWPSVTEGIMKFLMTSPILVPFATSKNKMWMCKLSYQNKYFEYIKNIEDFNITHVKFFGHNIINIW